MAMPLPDRCGRIQRRTPPFWSPSPAMAGTTTSGGRLTPASTSISRSRSLITICRRAGGAVVKAVVLPLLLMHVRPERTALANRLTPVTPSGRGAADAPPACPLLCSSEPVADEAETATPHDVRRDHQLVALGRVFGRRTIKAGGGQPAQVAGAPDREAEADAAG